MTDHPYTRLIDQRIDLFREAYRALDAVTEVAATELGPRTYDELAYPYAEVMPDTLTYQGGSEYEHTFMTNLYFLRKRHENYLDLLEVVREAILAVGDALDGVECTVTIKPTAMEDFAGQLDDNLIIMVSVTWTVGTLVDFADV